MSQISVDDLEEQKVRVTGRLLLLALNEGSRRAREENERLGLVPAQDPPIQHQDFSEELAATIEEAKRLGITLWANRPWD